MKVFKKILLVLVVVAGLVYVSTFFMDAEKNLKRSIMIDAPAAKVFSVINDITLTDDWSAWAKLDPNAKVTFEGPSTGVGAKRSWESEDSQVGIGSQWIVDSEPNKLVRMNMEFDGQDGTPQASLILNEEAGGTRLDYTFDAVMEGVINKLFGAMLESMLGPMYEESLTNLKELIEAMPDYSVDISIETAEPITYIGIMKEANPQDVEGMTKMFGEAYTELMVQVGHDANSMMGPPMSINHSWSEEKIVFQPSLTVSPDFVVQGDNVNMATTRGGKVVKAVHLGDYASLGSTYQDIYKFIAANTLETDGPNWEIYVTDPGNEPDTSKWVTHIYYPLK